MAGKLTKALRILTILALTILLWTASFSYSPRSEAEFVNPMPKQKVVLQLKWLHQFQFAGYYAAMEQGYFEEAGLDVEIREGRPDINPVLEVLKSQADFAIGNSEIVLYRMQGDPVVVLSAIFQHSPAVILTLESSGITDPHGISDRRIMLEKDSNGAEILAVLRDEGVSLSRIIRVEHTFDIMDLVNGNVDAIHSYSTNEPYVLEQLKIPYNMFLPRTYGIDFYGDCLFTSEKVIKEKPLAVKAFRDACNKGWEYAMANVDETISLILDKYSKRLSRDHLNYEASAIKELILPDIIEVGHINPGRWEFVAKKYVELGMALDDYSLDGFVYSVNPQVEMGCLKWYIGIVLAVSLLLGLIALGLFIFSTRLAREIKVRKIAEAESRESAERFRLLAENIPGIVYLSMADNDLKTTYANERVLEFTGYTREEFLSGEILPAQIFHPDDKDMVIRETRSALNSGKPHKIIYRILHKNGTWRWVEETCIAIYMDGKPLYIVGVILDTTDRVMAEENLKWANKETEIANTNLRIALEKAEQYAHEAEFANNAKSAFLANVSHEIRTPMNGIIGMANLLLDTRLSGEQRDYSETLLASSTSLLTIINDLLDFSKIESGKLVLDKQPFSIRDTIHEKTKMLSLKAQEKNLELSYFVEPDVPMIVVGDSLRFSQVLINLVGNAIKFTHEGEVAVRVSCPKTSERHSTIHVSISDTGIGIPQDKLEKLFQSFYQVDSSSTRKYGGTGLGLAISRNLVELMDGTITVESQQDKGSTFTFSVRFDLLPDCKAVELPNEKLFNLRVLIAEQSETSVLHLTDILTSSGCDCSAVFDSGTALQELATAAKEEHPFDIVFINMTIPPRGGEILLHRINAEPGLENLRTVMMMSMEESYIVSGEQVIDATATLSKPVSRDSLLRLLKELPYVTLGKTLERSSLSVLLVDDNPVNLKNAKSVVSSLGHTVTTAGDGKNAIALLKSVHFDLLLIGISMPVMGGIEVIELVRNTETGVQNPAIPIIALASNTVQADSVSTDNHNVIGVLLIPIVRDELASLIGKLDSQ